MDKPARHDVPWLRHEVATVRMLVEQGKSNAEIARILRRTPEAVARAISARFRSEFEPTVCRFCGLTVSPTGRHRLPFCDKGCWLAWRATHPLVGRRCEVCDVPLAPGSKVTRKTCGAVCRSFAMYVRRALLVEWW